ncbi:ABC transporter ATP-binding protein [soil metagenome]
MSITTDTPITEERSTGDSPIVIETRGLEKTYFGKLDVPVLFGLNIEIRAREFVAIVGQSGSGKSTLLNILGALDVPTGGTVLINGIDISTLDHDGLARLRSDDVGFIFQAHYLLDEFTCLENALMPITIRHGEASDEDRKRVLKLLERVGLGDQIDKHPDEMSGGQNQRCAIVRALANQPKIVLADEPTGNLDSCSGAEVFEMMREMNRLSGVAFVMITHDDRLAQAADRILLIEDGNIAEITTDDHKEKVDLMTSRGKPVVTLSDE